LVLVLSSPLSSALLLSGGAGAGGVADTPIWPSSSVGQVQQQQQQRQRQQQVQQLQQ